MLMTAAVGIGTAISALAAGEVYSVNVVGYATVTNLPSKFNLIAPPLKNGSNILNQIFTNLPPYSAVYLWQDGWTYFSYDPDYGLNDGAVVADYIGLNPGQCCFFYYDQATTNFPLTFVGEVVQGVISNNIPENKLTFMSMPIPVTTSLTNAALNFPSAPYDTIYKWDPNVGWAVFSYDPDYGWNDGAQQIDMNFQIGEGFLYIRGAGNGDAHWQFTYTVQ